MGLRPAGTEVAWMDTGLEAWSGWRVLAVVSEIEEVKQPIAWMTLKTWHRISADNIAGFQT